MDDTIPFFKSHYSMNRSILTLEKDHEGEVGPRSILKLVKDNNIKNAFLVDDNLSGLLELYFNSKDLDVNINFGLRITVCNNITEKNEASIKTESKYIIFLNDADGYENLSSIFSTAAKDGFYYVPRIDFENLKKYWSPSLSLGVPFYDSYLFNNHFRMSSCTPSEFWTTPTFFWEENELPFDSIYKEKLFSFVKSNFPASELIKIQSIYYENREDFLAYLTIRCLGKKSELQKPNLDHMCSDSFCLESFLENK